MTQVKMKHRAFKCWKREVWGIVRGLPLTRAATVIREIADSSFEAGELTRRGRESAYVWADRIYWRTKPL